MTTKQAREIVIRSLLAERREPRNPFEVCRRAQQLADRPRETADNVRAYARVARRARLRMLWSSHRHYADYVALAIIVGSIVYAVLTLSGAFRE